jgi:serpin B
MKKINLLLLSIFVLLITACTWGIKTVVIASTPGHLTSINKISTLNTKTVTNLNTFAINLYNELYSSDDNLFISPASIYLALGMTYNGANGSTKEEMARVLGANNISLNEFNILSRDLQYLMLGYENSKFELANSIWIRDTYNNLVKRDFIDRNKNYYGAMITSLDFNNPMAKTAINNWVNKNTHGRIKTAIDEDINPLTVMFLINTIYFKADWKVPFEKEKTISGSFNNANEIINVDMMNKVDKLGYVENDKLQGVLLPYNDSKTSMFILLPKNQSIISNLNADNIQSLITEMNNNKVDINLSMPKVKVEYVSSLKEPLSNLGMSHAFSGIADFSLMAENATEDGLYISDITHKSFLAIDGKGTEAAAMTKVTMDKTAMPISKYNMKVDHPFVLGIIDNESKAILFLGFICSPK